MTTDHSTQEENDNKMKYSACCTSNDVDEEEKQELTTLQHPDCVVSPIPLKDEMIVNDSDDDDDADHDS